MGLTLTEFQRFRCDRDTALCRGLQGAAGSGSVASDVRRRAVYGIPGTPRPYLLLEELRAAYRSAVVEYSQERAVVGSVPPGGDRDHQSKGENSVKVHPTLPNLPTQYSRLCFAWWLCGAPQAFQWPRCKPS